MLIEGGQALALLLVPFLCVAYGAKIANVSLLMVWAVVNSPALFALYIGSIFRYVGLDNFEIHLETIITISLMTLCPLAILIGLYWRFPAFFVDKIHLHDEWHAVEKRIKSSGRAVFFIFLILALYVLMDVVASGLYFRDYYINKVETNSSGILGLYNSVAVLIFCIALLDRKYALTIFIAVFFLILGKKHPLVYCILIPMLWSLIYQEVKLIEYLKVAVFGVFFFYVITQLYIPNRSVPLLLQLASSFDYIYNFDFFMGHYELGSASGEIFATSFYKWIPRFIWVDKPTVYGFLLIHKTLFPEEFVVGFFPSVFEGYAIWIADFGYLGIIFYIIINSAFLAFASSRKIGGWLRLIVLVWIIDPLIAIYLLVGEIIRRLTATNACHNNGKCSD